MKLRMVNYQLKLLLASVRKPVENSDAPRADGRDDKIEMTSRSMPAREPCD